MGGREGWRGQGGGGWTWLGLGFDLEGEWYRQE